VATMSKASRIGTQSGRTTRSASWPGPSSLWLDARGKRLPVPVFIQGFDTLGTLKHIMQTGFDYSWFILTRKIIEKEFALSGSEQKPRSHRQELESRLSGRVHRGHPRRPSRALWTEAKDFIVEHDLFNSRRSHETP